MMEVNTDESPANSWVLAEPIVHEEYKRIFGNEPALIGAVFRWHPHRSAFPFFRAVFYSLYSNARWVWP